MSMAARNLSDVTAVEHTSVMLGETLDMLAVREGGVFVDVTVGAAGHSTAILESSPQATLFAFDRDPVAVDVARRKLAPFGARATVTHASFGEVGGWLREKGIDSLDGVLADLGVSSPQLENPDRGMSFRLEGPIDMRMDPTSGETALELIQSMDQDDLADVIYRFGEEHRSRRVARCIKQAADAGELRSTLDLRRAVVRAVGPRRIGGVDPATRTFQALRMAVNQELEQLGALLALAERMVRPGGRAAIISFHSLEDRLVKRAFAERAIWQRLTKKPVVPTDRELDENPRSRSGKLRAAMRLGPGLGDRDGDGADWRSREEEE
jgi:16S rRNA (cytosine1402-N4)-methyltransferase